MLRIKGLTKRYRTGDLALKGIDLDVPDGQVMALIGPSGAGKSTVIRCINRLVEPTAGTITLNDTEITDARQPRIAPRAPAHGDDLPGIRAGRAAHGDGERAERTARLCRLLAELHAEISASRHRRGVPAARPRRPRRTWPTSAPTSCPAASASASASAGR